MKNIKITNCPMHYHNNKTKKHMCMAQFDKRLCTVFYGEKCPYLYTGRTNLISLLKHIKEKRK